MSPAHLLGLVTFTRSWRTGGPVSLHRRLRCRTESGRVPARPCRGDDSARYLQILPRLRLRGLQLDERAQGLEDHFLQQVII